MKPELIFLLAALSLSSNAQPWSAFLNSSRAIDWTSGVGFTIPNYTVPCASQPTLATGSGNAAANTTSIQNALASCNSTHNVVSIPAGTYYVNPIIFPDHGYQVLRGAGPTQTDLIETSTAGSCPSSAGICMSYAAAAYNGSAAVLPPSGSQQCLWTAGYSQGTTSITLSSCGGAPPSNAIIVLDQANDTSDNGGVYICDGHEACDYAGNTNYDGRVIGGITHSQQQLVYTTGVTSLGGGSYTVTISPGVYFTNVRSGQSPGAWWSASPSMTSHDGLENLKVDGTSTPSANIAMIWCYQCWVKNVMSVYSPRDHVNVTLSLADVVRDSYFYAAQSSGTDSYAIEFEESSAALVENNIFQQTTVPIMMGQNAGTVIGYNFSIDNVFGSSNYMNGAYAVHNAGNEMNLWEGNVTAGIWADDAWGASDQQTYFRNMAVGWQHGDLNSTWAIYNGSFVRNFNVVGNILGQPGYHNQYQTYATSSTGGVGAANANTSIYSLGWAQDGQTCTTPPICDAVVFTTIVRWGNYDTVNAATQWNSTEASPGAVAYVNANFTSTYFGSLPHTLPSSLYYSSTPSWWPSAKAWPPIGPDISSGNVGICSSGSSYPGSQATSSAQCTGGTLSSAWASHVISIPAQDCYLNTMGGPPDGSGSVLNFDANVCYASSGTGPASPTGLTATAQ